MPTSVKAITLPPPLPALPPELPGSDAIVAHTSANAIPSSGSTALVAHRAGGTALVAHKAVGLLTSGHNIKVLLERTGFKDQRLDGAEKLDLLTWMADAVKGNVAKRKKMKLALKELDDFLVREGMAPKKNDAKSTISELLALRRRELARLDYTRLNEQETEDERFQLALVEMPAEDVDGCFALVPYVDPGEVVKGSSRACNVM